MPKSWLMNMTREDVIRIALEVGFDDGEVNTCQLMLENFAYLVAKQEREACEALCAWRTGVQQVDAAIDTCAAAIRARGQA